MARGKAKAETKTKPKTTKKKQKAVKEAEEVEVEEVKPELVEAELEKTSPAEEAKEVAKEEAEELEEKFYDLNLRRIWTAPREKRTPRAVRFLRAYVARRMKTDDVAISEEANSMLWARGIG